MGSRRQAREAALQFLYQDDFPGAEEAGDDRLADRFEQFCVIYQISRKARAYALQLLTGIGASRGEVDEIIRESAANWRLERLALTDRNLLRIAVYEMLWTEDVPPQVAINEAVEIAKRFGGGESPAFVNGILDAVRQKRLPQP